MPSISLTSINSALEKKMDGTDSSSNLADVLRLANAADDFTSSVFYDSTTDMPTDSAFIGTLARKQDGTVFIYDGTDWTRPNKDGTISGGIVATGGDSTVDISGFRYHVFRSDGTLEVTSAGGNIEYLVVAGGGAGGDPGDATVGGGGGGAGGVSHHTGKAVTVTSYSVTVGAGGVATSRTSGSDSVFFGTTSKGGGVGGHDNSQGRNGTDGGSGGGGGVHGGAAPGGASTQTDTGGATGYGNAGGNNRSTSPYEGGGGGGADSAGHIWSDTNGAEGGSGKYFANFTNWGTDASNDASSGGGYFGGGGGSGDTKYGTIPNRAGGAGGGGTGNTSAGIDGTGGGGGCHFDGGDGIVIIRYEL